jgi:phosphatidyl-myo-inositol alpha-mannosyltransferase
VRVAIVCPYAWDRPGGVQSHIRSLARALQGRGHVVRVFASRSLRSEGGLGADAAEVEWVGRAVGVPANGSIAPICFGPVAAYRIRHELAGFDPDVVHLHEPLIPSLSLLALLSTRAPVVGTFHAAAASNPLYRIFRRVLAPLAQRLAVRTAVSDAAARLVSRYFPGPIDSTPNGIDAASFAGGQPIDLGSRLQVLFLGRLEPRKGAEVALEAMDALKDIGPALVVAGEGPLRTELEATAARLDLDVQFLGVVSETDKLRLLSSCDVFCAPNLGGESFGIVLVEAMASGCAIVCSDLAEFKAVADDAAVFVPAGDPVSLAEALRSVLTDPERADALRERARGRATLYDWARIVPGVEEIYERAFQTRH